jgi:hypothetical protein
LPRLVASPGPQQGILQQFVHGFHARGRSIQQKTLAECILWWFSLSVFDERVNGASCRCSSIA